MLEIWEPPSQPHHPQREICNYHLNIQSSRQRPRRSEHQTKNWIGRLLLRKHELGNFANQRDRQPGGIIFLRAEIRFNQLALADADKVPGFSLEVPNLYVRQHFECRTKAALRPLRTRSYSPHAPRRATQEADQPVGLSHRITSQDNCFRFSQRHAGVGAPTRGKTPQLSGDGIESFVITTPRSTTQTPSHQNRMYSNYFFNNFTRKHPARLCWFRCNWERSPINYRTYFPAATPTPLQISGARLQYFCAKRRYSHG